MELFLQKLRKIMPQAQRGDSGTIYIVFIMVLIIGAAYVMVNGLQPEFDDNAVQQTTAEQQTNFVNGPGNLPSLPAPGSPEEKHAKECADKVKEEADRFTRTGKSRTIEGC